MEGEIGNSENAYALSAGAYTTKWFMMVTKSSPAAVFEPNF
jgi:hypothetical protein